MDLAATSLQPVIDWTAFLRGYAPDDDLRRQLSAKLVVHDDLVRRSLQLLRTRHLARHRLTERLGALQRELTAA